MLSSYKVIKSNSIVTDGNVEINTSNISIPPSEKKELGEKNAKNFIESYEVLAKTMLENARRQSDDMLAIAYEDARRLEQEAQERGMTEGYAAGYEKGIQEANKYYNEMMDKAQRESKELINKSEELFKESNKQYIEYLHEKKEEIQDLIISITENILKREVKDKDAITNMVLDAIEIASKSKTIVIKTRSSYLEDLKEKIETWKHQAIFKGDVFVIADDELDEGTAVIQRNNGKIVISINDALEKVREIITLNS